MIVHCPRCSTAIDTTERCPEFRGLGRCQELTGHVGWHWTQVAAGSIVRWTGLYSTTGCYGRLGMEPVRWCLKKPGHAGMHFEGSVAFGDPEPG